MAPDNTEDVFGYQHGDQITLDNVHPDTGQRLTVTLLDEVGSGTSALVRAAWIDPGADVPDGIPTRKVLAARISPLPDPTAAATTVLHEQHVTNLDRQIQLTRYSHVTSAGSRPDANGAVPVYAYGQATAPDNRPVFVVIMAFAPFTLNDAIKGTAAAQWVDRIVHLPDDRTVTYTLGTRSDGWGDFALSLMLPRLQFLAWCQTEGLVRRDVADLNTGILQDGSTCELDLEDWAQAPNPLSGVPGLGSGLDPQRTAWAPVELLTFQQANPQSVPTYTVEMDAAQVGLQIGRLALARHVFDAAQNSPIDVDTLIQQWEGSVFTANLESQGAKSVAEILKSLLDPDPRQRRGNIHPLVTRAQQLCNERGLAVYRFVVQVTGAVDAATENPYDQTAGGQQQHRNTASTLPDGGEPGTRRLWRPGSPPEEFPQSPPVTDTGTDTGTAEAGTAEAGTAEAEPEPVAEPVAEPEPALEPCPAWMKTKVVGYRDEAAPDQWVLLDVVDGALRYGTVDGAQQTWENIPLDGVRAVDVAVTDAPGTRIVYVVTDTGDVLSGQMDGLTDWRAVWTTADRSRASDGALAAKASRVVAATGPDDTPVVLILTEDGKVYQHSVAAVTARLSVGWTHWDMYSHVTHLQAFTTWATTRSGHLHRDGVTVIGRENDDGLLYARHLNPGGWTTRRHIGAEPVPGPLGNFEVTVAAPDADPSNAASPGVTSSSRTTVKWQRTRRTADGVFAGFLPDGSGFLTQTADGAYTLVVWTQTPPPAKPAPTSPAKPTVPACPSWMRPRAAVIPDKSAPGSWIVLDTSGGHLRSASSDPDSGHGWQTMTLSLPNVMSVAAVDSSDGTRFLYVVTGKGDVLSARSGASPDWTRVWTAQSRTQARQVTAASDKDGTPVVVVRTVDGELWLHKALAITTQADDWVQWPYRATDVHAVPSLTGNVAVVSRYLSGKLNVRTRNTDGSWNSGERRDRVSVALGPGGEYNIKTAATEKGPRSTTVTEKFGNGRTGTAEGEFAALLPDGSGFLTQTLDNNYLLATWGKTPAPVPRHGTTGIPAPRTAAPTKTTGDDHPPPPKDDIPLSRAAVSADVPRKTSDGVAPTPKVDEEVTAEPTPAKSGGKRLLAAAVALLLVVVAGVVLDLKFGFVDGWLGRGSDTVASDPADPAEEKGQASPTVDPATAQQMTEQSDFRTDLYDQTVDAALPGAWPVAGTLPILSATTTSDCYRGQRCVTVRVMARLDERVPAAQPLTVDTQPQLIVRGRRTAEYPVGGEGVNLVGSFVDSNGDYIQKWSALRPNQKTNAKPTRWDYPAVKPGHTVGDPDGPGSRLTFILPNGATTDDIIGLAWGLPTADNRSLVTSDVAAALRDPGPRFRAGACFADTPGPGPVPDVDPVPCDGPHEVVILGTWPSTAVSDAGLTLEDLANPTSQQASAMIAVLGPDRERCDTAKADLLGSNFPSRFSSFLRWGVDATGTPVARCHLTLLSRDETSEEPLPADVAGSLAAADGRWRYSQCAFKDPFDLAAQLDEYTYCRAGVDIRFASTRTYSGSPAPPYPGDAAVADQAVQFCASQNVSGVWATAPPRETWTFGSYDCWMPVDQWRQMEGLPPLT